MKFFNWRKTVRAVLNEPTGLQREEEQWRMQQPVSRAIFPYFRWPIR